ncbi:hypothetical protein QBC35DRAFT_445432 [Podospora australis]|uniref:Uncharacterized protein n=1 Tax=Podospora australis TaxID=1536484 RepID=A0AAN6WIJ1_9PEZI|nr:hypothetical protein QBC35DRAFT_445432 [Podospora australis]
MFLREVPLPHLHTQVREVEKKTGHGWVEHLGADHFEEGRGDIRFLTAGLGNNLYDVLFLFRRLDGLDELCDYIKQGITKLIKMWYSADDDDRSILQAVKILSQYNMVTRTLYKELESRIQNQISVLFFFLTHEDTKFNISLADVSGDLAEATRRDGSSMKTTAVLTMAFLPATLLAAMFSIPFLGWDENYPEKFAIDWAAVIPATIATFAVWAGFTQKEQAIQISQPSSRGQKLVQGLGITSFIDRKKG